MPAQQYTWEEPNWLGYGQADILIDPFPFVLGVDKPDATNTGLLSLPTTTLTGTQTYSVNNATEVVISDTRFEGFVNVTGRKYRFYNCEFVGPVSFTPIDRGLVNCSNTNCRENVFERCKFRPQTPTYGLDGIFGHHFTTIRNDISRTEDGIGVAWTSGGSGLQEVLIQGDYIHDLLYTCPNPFQSDNRSHCDGIQLHYPNGVTIHGVNVQAFIDIAVSTYAPPTFNGPGGQQDSGYQYYSTGETNALSGVLIGAVGPVLGQLTIKESWFDGSAFAFLNGHPNWTAGGPVLIDGNRWGRTHAAVADDWVYSMNTGVDDTITNNTYEDNGAPFNIRKNP